MTSSCGRSAATNRAARVRVDPRGRSADRKDPGAATREEAEREGEEERTVGLTEVAKAALAKRKSAATKSARRMS
jgi:hypothetical protein